MPEAVPPAADLPALPGEAVRWQGRAGGLAGSYAQPSPPGPQPRVPLLLVHSVNAAASRAEMRPLYEHAMLQRPVLAIDLPGFGLSERSDRPYTPRLMSDAVHDAIDWLRQRQACTAVDVLALSLSCEFAARATVEAPTSVRRLALVSPTGFRGTRARRAPVAGSVGPAWLLRLMRGPGWGPFLYRKLTRPGVIRYFLERTWGSKQIDEELWRACVATSRAAGAEHAPLHFLAAQLFSTDVNTLYEQLKQPVWVTHGTRGDFTDYRLLHTVQDRPNWKLRVWPETGALMYFEQPQAFNAALERFLDRSEFPAEPADGPAAAPMQAG